MMDKNTIIGLVLIFLLFIGFSMYTAPSKEEREAAMRSRDSIAQVLEEEKRIADSLYVVEQEEVEVIEVVGDDAAVVAVQAGSFTQNTTIEEQEIAIENELIKYTFTNKGGRIKKVELIDVKTFDGRPLVLFDEDDSRFSFSFFSNSMLVETDKVFFELQNDNLPEKVSGNDSVVLVYRLFPSNEVALNEEEVLSEVETSENIQIPDRSSYLELRYVIRGNDYMTPMSLNLSNMSGVIQANSTSLDLVWEADIRRLEKNQKYEGMNTTIFYYDGNDVDKISESKLAKKDFTTSLKWVSFKQHFFSATLLACEENFESGDIETQKVDNEEEYLKNARTNLIIPIKSLDDASFNMQWFFGPNKYSILSSYDQKMERQIPLGWSFAPISWINRFAVIKVFNWLENYGISYGIIILILTVILKLVLLPIAYKTYMSSAKMRLLKPEIEAINAKYPKQEDSMKKQQAVMALQKKAGVNPMAGCLPMLLQLPILLAMFRFFPTSYELRQQPFLWATDLSSYDSILDLPFSIPFYGDHVSLFTLLMTLATLLYTHLNNKMMNTGAQNMQAMKVMMYFMPVMFLGIFNNYSSALSYYYFLVNMITFLQMFGFRYLVNEDKLRAKMEAHKQKPVKKSGWAKRLEEMQKQQQQAQQQQKRRR